MVHPPTRNARSAGDAGKLVGAATLGEGSEKAATGFVEKTRIGGEVLANAHAQSSERRRQLASAASRERTLKKRERPTVQWDAPVPNGVERLTSIKTKVKAGFGGESSEGREQRSTLIARAGDQLAAGENDREGTKSGAGDRREPCRSMSSEAVEQTDQPCTRDDLVNSPVVSGALTEFVAQHQARRFNRSRGAGKILERVEFAA